MHTSFTASRPFDLPWHARGLLTGPLVAAARGLCEHTLGLARLNRCYDWIQARLAEQASLGELAPLTQEVPPIMPMRPAAPRRSFAELALASVGVSLTVSDADLARIPKTGPLVFVANHPYGGIDGLALALLMERVRPDGRLIVNYLLRAIPEIAEISFLVDPFGGEQATVRNLAGIKAAMRHVFNGGALGMFPAGEVSHATWRSPRVTDSPWISTVGRIVQMSAATVMPVYFEGGNGWLFQLAGLLHPRLRTALLPRELLNKHGRPLRVRVGNPITPARLQEYSSPDELTRYLRFRTYLLRGRREDAAAGSAGSPQSRLQGSVAPGSVQAPLRRVAPGGAGRALPPVAVAQPDEKIRAEMAALPPGQMVVRGGAFQVYFARAGQIPTTLLELGRLRELTFRSVGEGVGRERDLDRFDDYYLHLILWDHVAGRLAGAYRMGLTDEILRAHGPGGLYTATLFRYSPALLQQISPGIELGRSFVVSEYQRSHSALLLLWKGVGHFIAERPQYRYIFGAVSISDEYQSLTKSLLLAFLQTSRLRSDLADQVQAKLPPRPARLRDADPSLLATAVQDVAHVDELVAELEAEQRHIPVLLRQYMRMNAKVLGFNIDPAFGDVIDALILADMPHANIALLRRYFGEAGTARLRAYHGVVSAPADGDAGAAVALGASAGGAASRPAVRAGG